MVKCLPAMRETWVRFLAREEPLEKEMAIHSSTPACKIPWTEELIGYSPWGHKESDTTERLHFTSCNISLYSIRLYFHHQSHPQLSVVFVLAPSLHSFLS